MTTELPQSGTCQEDSLPEPANPVARWPSTNPSKLVVDRVRSWPRISVITPSFNQAPYLESTIRSVLLQGYPNLEYIVIDGGSTDGSVGIIRKYAGHLTYWVSEPDRGQSHAINKGFDRATGEILAWLNSDDFYMPGVLVKIAETFAQSPEVGVVYGDCLFLDSAGSSTLTPSEPIDLRRMLVGKNPLWQPSTFFRQRVLDQVGGLDESLHFALDYELWLRALKVAQFLRIDDGPLSVVHDYPQTKSRGHWSEFMAEILLAVDRFYSTPGVPADAIPLRRSVYARLHFECASASILGEGSLARAIPPIARALRTDPRVLLKVPWVTLQLLRWVARRAA